MVPSAVFVILFAGTAVSGHVWVQKESQECWSIYTADYSFGTVSIIISWLCFAKSWATVLNTIHFWEQLIHDPRYHINDKFFYFKLNRRHENRHRCCHLFPQCRHTMTRMRMKESWENLPEFRFFLRSYLGDTMVMYKWLRPLFWTVHTFLADSLTSG